MSVGPLAVPMMATAGLLAMAGAQKVVDPTMTVGALRAMRLPSAPALVRLGSAIEMALGVGALAVGGSLVWGLMAVSFLAFAAFLVAAMRKGTMVATCGCFGREETPPHWIHVVVNLALAGVAGAAASWYPDGLVDEMVDHPADALVLVAMGALASYLVYVTMVDLPRALVSARSVSSV